MSLEKGENNFDVVVVGAGISGINFAYRLQERNPDLSFTILESRNEMGGTWSLFKYPGIRSDSDLYTFGFPWRPWNDKSSIAQGPLILEYVKESASMYGIDKKIQYNRKVDTANWSSEHKTWTLGVTANDTKTETFRCKFMLLCTGYYDYDQPLQTTIPGIDDFRGQVIHPQFWPEDLDYTNKDIVIVGSGATAVTLLPVLAEKTSHVTMLQRSPSYIISQPTEDGFEKKAKAWFSDTWAHRLIRWKWIFMPWLFVRISTAFPNYARKSILGLASKQLPSNTPIDPHFSPRYDPWEQRLCLCPDADFYKSLRAGKASVETGSIETVTQNSIRLTNGKELQPDIIVTATGLKLVFAGGIKVALDGTPFNVPEKFVWKGVMLEDLPNLAFVIGYVDASWTLGADATAQIVCRMLNQMRKEKVVALVPRRSEADKKNMKEEPLLRLQSTYVKKALDSIHQSGDRGQWRPRSFYYKDILMAWFGDIKTNMEWVRGV